MITKPENHHAPPFRSPQPELLQPSPLENKMNTATDQNRPAIFIQSTMNATLVHQTVAALAQSPIVYWAGEHHQGYFGYRGNPVVCAGQENLTVVIDSTFIQTPDLHVTNPNMGALPHAHYAATREPVKVSQDEIAAYFIELFTKLKAVVELLPNVIITLTPGPRHISTPDYQNGNHKHLINDPIDE